MQTKVAVISGSSSGIGAACAQLYARQGWNVLINYARGADAAQAVAEQCRALGVEVLVLQGDVSVDADCQRLAAQADQHWGRVDVLVNNAGTTKFVPIKDLAGLQAEDFQRIYAVNVVGAYQMTRAFTPLLQRYPVTGVVNISSIAGLMGTGSSIAYMASKGALNAMTVGLARALGPQIRVNAIAPGLVETPWMQDGLGAARYAATVQAYTERAALEAVMSPQDIAEAAWWLGAGAAKTTGEVLLVDAGFKITRA